MANGPMYNPFAPVQGQPVEPGPNAFPFSPAFGRNPMTAVVQAPQRARLQAPRPATTAAPLGLLGQAQPVQGQYGSLLDEIRNQAGRAGLAQTLMGLGRTTRRGEDRLLGAVQMGQQAQQQAYQQGVQELATRMKLEEAQRAMEKEQRDRESRAALQAYLTGQPQTQVGPASATTVAQTPQQKPLESVQRTTLEDQLSERYDPYEIGQMTTTEKVQAQQAIRFENAAAMAAAEGMSDQAKNFRDQAEAINKQIGTKFLPREKRAELSYSRRDQWDKTEYRPRVEQVAKARQLVQLAKNPNAITDISLIFGLMKSLDPRSTVRDSEAAMVENAQGAFARLQNIQARIQEGRLLPNEAYPMIVENALIVADAVEKDYQAAVQKRLPTLSDVEGLNPEIVIPYRTLNAPDIEASIREVRQAVGSTGSTTGGNPASTIKSIKSRGGVGQ